MGKDEDWGPPWRQKSSGRDNIEEWSKQSSHGPFASQYGLAATPAPSADKGQEGTEKNAWEEEGEYDHRPPPFPPPPRGPPLSWPYPEIISGSTEQKENGKTRADNQSLVLIIGIPSLCLLLLVLAVIVFFCIFRRRRSSRPQIISLPPVLQTHEPKTSNSYTEHTAILPQDPWLVDRSHLVVNFDKKLGAGAFCNVFHGHLKRRSSGGVAHAPRSFPPQLLGDLDVAVKVLPDFADAIARSDFMQEINFMKRLSYHPHLVSMLAWVSSQPSPLLVVELCIKGDLLHFIRRNKDDIVNGYENLEGLKFKDVLSFTWQVANGLEYLNSIGCIHRDVAARNVLVDAENHCKIGDFGLCRLMDSLIYQARGGRLPLRWMSPKALASLEYSFKSDVWAYGVLVWELFSLGDVPYLGIDSSALLPHLNSGNRLPRPSWCTDEIFSLLLQCWDEDPLRRPDFSSLSSQVAAMLEKATEEYGYLRP